MDVAHRQTLIDKNTVPPNGGFKYMQDGLGKDADPWIRAPSWIQLVQAVKERRRVNNIPIGPELEQEIETQLCSTLPPGICTYSDPHQKKRAEMITRPSWEKYLEATSTILKLIHGGLAAYTEANQHAAICAKCPYNQSHEAGCTACSGQEMANLLATYSVRKTEYDSRLKGCIICGCALKAKVYVPGKIAKEVAAKYLDVLPDHCWVKQ